MELDQHRAIIHVSLSSRDGKLQTEKFWIDSGNPDLVITERLARDLGLDLSSRPEHDDFYGTVVRVKLPAGRVGTQLINFDGVEAIIPLGSGALFPGMNVAGNLPSSILKNYDIVLDYPKKQFTIAAAGTLKPRGVAIPCHVQSGTGMVSITAIIDGQQEELAVDNGASYSLLKADLIQHLVNVHPSWPTIEGSVGAANEWGTEDEVRSKLVRIPVLRLDGIELKFAGMSSVSENFIHWYSGKTAAPVAGLIGGNLLQQLRIEIHYHKAMLYLENRGSANPHDMDVAGLILRPDPEGGYSVIGMARKDGSKPAQDLLPGDRLVAVDGVSTAGRSMGAATRLLRGKVGDTRTLKIERGGTPREVEIQVLRYW